jgi:hypothetical protein
MNPIKLENRKGQVKRAMQKVQVHIAGTVRTGKTTLANNLVNSFLKLGLPAAALDVDYTRTTTFGADEPILGSLDPTNNPADKAKFDLQKKMQAWSYNNVFDLQIPMLSNAGVTPIFTATHAWAPVYDRVQKIADSLGNRLCFILLEETSLDEMVRRCMTDQNSKSDMVGDPRENPTLLNNWKDITHRIHEAYDNSTKPMLRVSQGTPEEMTGKAMTYILESAGYGL